MSRKFALICAVGVGLMLPATAGAKTIKQTGQIVGDDATRVTLKVETSSGEPLEVADFKARNVFTRCDKKPDRIDFTALDPIEVESDDTFKTRLTDNDGGYLRIAGKVKDGGKVVVGNLKTNEVESSAGLTCKTPKQKFKTSR